MGVWGVGGGFDRGALCCSMLSFVRTQMLPFSTLVHQAFMPVRQLSMCPHHHHTIINHRPSFAGYFAWAWNWQLLALSPSPAVNQYDLTEWLICLSFSHMRFLKYETVWHCSFSLATPPLYTQMDTKREPWCFLSPAAFKASLDKLGCFWKTFFHQSRGQTHLSGKRGEKKERWHVWILAYNILHLFPFFLPQTALASFDQLQQQWGCV